YQTSETLSNADFNQNDIAVYYNISNDHLVLDGIKDLNTIQHLKIYNIIGQAIQSFDSVTTQEVSMSALTSGIYIAEIIETSGVKTTLKFVKQ
uniref:T9SS type A sorting domain-containing protein n=1 Tax=uncultured Olleya sp. TaxID=757243 RepID=UPI002599F77E